jgi:hypothetical protein
MGSRVITDQRARPISAVISIVLTACTLGYFLPWMIAALRGKSNAWPIFWFNLLLGWTVVGFVVAFVLAVSRHAASGRGILGPTTLTLILLRGWSDHPPEGTRPEHVHRCRTHCARERVNRRAAATSTRRSTGLDYSSFQGRRDDSGRRMLRSSRERRASASSS